MRMPRTSTTGHAILGLLALRPSWTTTEITSQLRRNMRYFWPRALSGVFAESRRLVESGHARSSSEPRQGRGAPQRTRYRITAAGRRRVSKWLDSPPRATSLESEALLRVLLADLGTIDQVRRAIATVAAEADELLELAEVIADEYASGTAPFQDHVHARALVFDFLVGYAAHCAEWSARADAAVAGWPTLSRTRRDAAAIALIQERLASARSTTRSASTV